jgi:hypothetical protein
MGLQHYTQDMSKIPLKYHTNVLFYTKYTHPTLICRGTDGRMDARTDGRSENIYSIFRDKLLLLGEHVYDYAMIEFVSDDGTIATCPAMILEFVRYNITLGIPTPQLTGEEELSLNPYKKTWLLTTPYMWWFIQHQIMGQVNNWMRNFCHHLSLEML